MTYHRLIKQAITSCTLHCLFPYPWSTNYTQKCSFPCQTLCMLKMIQIIEHLHTAEQPTGVQSEFSAEQYSLTRFPFHYARRLLYRGRRSGFVQDGRAKPPSITLKNNSRVCCARYVVSAECGAIRTRSIVAHRSPIIEPYPYRMPFVLKPKLSSWTYIAQSSAGFGGCGKFLALARIFSPRRTHQHWLLFFFQRFLCCCRAHGADVVARRHGIPCGSHQSYV